MQREIISEIVIEIVLIRVMNGDCCRYIVVDLKYNLDNQISYVYRKAVSLYYLLVHFYLFLVMIQINHYFIYIDNFLAKTRRYRFRYRS